MKKIKNNIFTIKYPFYATVPFKQFCYLVAKPYGV